MGSGAAAVGNQPLLADDRPQAIRLLMLARLSKHMVDIDTAHCPNCAGELKLMAAILKKPVIENIRTHLSLQA